MFLNQRIILFASVVMMASCSIKIPPRFECRPGQAQPCYLGPDLTEDVGQCAGGLEHCTGEGTWSGVCAGQILPNNEVCNGIDDDCDGFVDELTACWSSELPQGSPDFEIIQSKVTGLPISISHQTIRPTALIPHVPGESREAYCLRFIDQFGPLFGFSAQASTKDQLEIVPNTEASGDNHLRMRQIFNGIPVFDGKIDFHFAGEDLVLVTSSLLPVDLSLNVTPTIDATAAMQAAGMTNMTDSEVMVFVRESLETTTASTAMIESHLAWRLTGDNATTFVDAHEGTVLLQDTRTNEALQYEVYNAGNDIDERNDRLVITEAGGNAMPTPSEQLTADSIEAYYQLLRAHVGRDSIDNRGRKLVGRNNYLDEQGRCRVGDLSVAASWNGRDFVICSNQDEQLAFRHHLVGHELTHGLINHTAGLVYQGQSGAVNEAFAEIFGALVNCEANPDRCTTGQDDTQRWTYAPETSNFSTLRDICPGRTTLATRGLCPQDPQKECAYDCLSNDYGYIHRVRSVIVRPYRTFFQKIGDTPSERIDRTLQIAYYVLNKMVRPRATLSEVALNTIQACRVFAATQRYGLTDLHCGYVQGAFLKVGLPEGICIPTSEICDGLDNDCDAVIDDGTDPEAMRLVDEGRFCGSTLTDVGACRVGETACELGRLVCRGEQPPQPESCNGIDDDCNDVVDDGLPHEECCVPGVLETCQGEARGSCQPGTRTCQPDLQWGDCIGTIGPAPEICESAEVDEDCDGSSNEGCACTDASPPRACGIGRGACGLDGTQNCINGNWSECAGATQPGTEICNGIDDDCDGLIDEDPLDEQRACATGQLGVCSEGLTRCENGNLICVRTRAPSVEICGNNEDEDCSGAIDDRNVAETCNGIDDDCDGEVDEGACRILLPRGTVCGLGHTRNMPLVNCDGYDIDGTSGCGPGWRHLVIDDRGAGGGTEFFACLLVQDTFMDHLPRGLLCGYGHNRNHLQPTCEGHTISYENPSSCPAGYVHSIFGDWGEDNPSFFGCVLQSARPITFPVPPLPPQGLLCGLSHSQDPENFCRSTQVIFNDPSTCPPNYRYAWFGDYGLSAGLGQYGCVRF